MVLVDAWKIEHQSGDEIGVAATKKTQRDSRSVKLRSTYVQS